MPTILTPNIELLDLMLNLDERQGLEYAFISIRPNTRILNPKDPAVLRSILETIKEKIRDQEIRHGISKSSAIIASVKEYLKTYPQIQLEKTFFTFPLANPTLPQKGDDGSIEELIDLKLKPGKINDEKTGQIDYHDLGFSDTLIHDGKPLVVITHATPGVDGIDIFKQPIKSQPGDAVKVPDYDKKTIACEDVLETDQTILKASITGFLYKDFDRGYFIDKDVLTDQVDFTTGNIEVQDFEQIDSTIKVSGSQDILHNSVKPGFTLKAKEIIIEGNVGQDATIEGDKIIITGIVSANARITGHDIEIGKVIGAHVVGNKIKINSVLQNATVIGEDIRIKTTMSSQISGNEVFISEELRSGSVTAASFIFCRKATGTSHSTLAIDPFAVPSFQQKLKDQQTQVENQHQLYQKRNLLFEKEQNTHKGRYQSHIDNFYRQIENEKKISLSKQQKKAIEQLLTHGSVADVSQKLNFKIDATTNTQLTNFTASLSRLRDSFAEVAELNQAHIDEKNILLEMKEAYTRGLILISDESSGEIKICYHDTCLSPIVFNQNLLFCFDKKRKKIFPLKKIGMITHQRLLTNLSSRALAAVNNFASLETA
ncbi:MAG: hypothetical protein DRH03_06435 [Deltaproteobacteria bacterium]|nr:MAG: hypothetical protein DRH03_06435 [Deltaproteobacteria bacterium]